MKTPQFLQTLSGVCFGALSLASVNAQTTTTMTSSSNWVGGNWDNGEPTTDTNVVIASGVTASAVNSVSPWSGSLTLEPNSILNIQAGSNPNPPNMAFEGANAFILGDNSFIIDNFKTTTFDEPFTISGTAGMDSTNNSGNNHGRTFNAEISGGTWVTDGRNHIGYNYQVANTFTAYEIRCSESQRHGVRFNAPGSAGLGDVTVTNGNPTVGAGQSAVIILGADNVFAPTAKLTLNGGGWDNTTGGFGPVASGPWVGTRARIALQGFTATVSELWVDDVQIPSGTYTGGDADWIVGSGSLIVQESDPIVPLVLGIASAVNPGTGFDLEWPSKESKLYRIRSSATLDTEPATWAVVEEDIASAGATTSTNVTPGETKLFYVVEEYDAPPAN